MNEVKGINSVEIAIHLLEIFAKQNTPMRATDLATLSGLSKSRLHKYLISLCRCDVIFQDTQTGKYALGDKLSTLSRSSSQKNSELIAVNNALCKLRDQLNISTGLAILDGSRVCLTNYNRSHKAIDMDYRPNLSLPLTQSAVGKIFLSFSEQLAEDNTLLNPLEKKKIQKQGYSVRATATPGIPGDKAIACPVYNQQRKMIAAAVLIGFLFESEDEIANLAEQLMNSTNIF